ncbi:MAG TPA: MoaD/ThiS family protein [Desulfuromonadaceae bacterium]|nr:MoaD/ThiS family protein [Desulfuromonadaceae bacterium]
MHILFFAQVKDAVGVSEMSLTISGPLRIDEVWARLTQAQPKLAPFQKTTRLARNGEYAEAGTIFSDADEVALIPPVSGG